MKAISMDGGTTTSTKKAKGWWMKLVMVLTVALACVAVVAVQAQAGSFDHRPPHQVLFKGAQLQRGIAQSESIWWHSYDENGGWGVYDPGYSGSNHWPNSDVVPAGSRLRIRIAKPQHPYSVRIEAYRRLDVEGGEGWPAGRPQILKSSFDRVERDGKTVAWNVYFRVKEPERHYYLWVTERWAQVPGTHISYGTAAYLFHVRTS
jgi:hypothetical protein